MFTFWNIGLEHSIIYARKMYDIVKSKNQVTHNILAQIYVQKLHTTTDQMHKLKNCVNSQK